MNLQQLKRKLQGILGIADSQISDSQLIQIVNEIKNIPSDERSESKLQEIVTSITGIDSFLIVESLDNSDIDNIIDQIEDALKNRK